MSRPQHSSILHSETLFARRLVPVLFLGLFLLVTAAPVTAAPTATVRHVTLSGSDWANPACAVTSPCRTIQYAMGVANNGDKIKVAAGTFNEHNILVSKNVQIIGQGIRNTVITGTQSGTVFVIPKGINATIKSMRIKKGNGNQGGGVRNLGTLKLKNVTLSENHASTGGGIYNEGILNLTSVVLYKNSAGGFGGGLYNSGGDHAAALLLVDVNSNSATLGGGIASFSSLLLFHSAVHDTTNGGGILSKGESILLNVTISGNANPGTSGAGMAVTGGKADLHYVTLSSNAGYGIFATGGSIILNKSIAYNNSSNSQCGSSVIGSYSDGGHNVLADQSCGYWPGTGSLIANPRLKPLAFNGGISPTHALKPASPAIDLVPPKLCTPIDQRQVARPIDGDGVGKAKCDAGAYEYQP